MAASEVFIMYQCEFENTVTAFQNAVNAFEEAGTDPRREKVVESSRDMIRTALKAVEALQGLGRAVDKCQAYMDDNAAPPGDDKALRKR